MGSNLYVHFPFCRTKCAYCALHSGAGKSDAERVAYVRALAAELASAPFVRRETPCDTIYFGGGTPALADLSPLADALVPLVGDETEFTVELHPLDVTDGKLSELKALGVNRISMGVQSLDDGVLGAMGRGYASDRAESAFARVREAFPNAGIDLIVGYPGDDRAVENLARLSSWGLAHCSVYSLQNERGLADVPDDDTVLNRIRAASEFLASLGLVRYEISNYARPGFECRHNLAVWNGEDYVGLGDGACGREGLLRTRGRKGFRREATSVTPEEDEKERTLFRLRIRAGLDAARHPDWIPALDRFVRDGLLVSRGSTVYALTARGTEVCDAILAELV